MKKDKLSIKTEILKEIFSLAPERYNVNESDTSVLAKKLQVSKEELQNSLEFLFEIYLIKKTPGPNYKKDRTFEWTITEKGLDYLEKKEAEKKQENINTELLRATIIIAVATALNVLIMLFIFLLNLEKSHWSRPIALAVIGIAIAGLSGRLFKEIWYFLFQKGKKNKTNRQQNNNIETDKKDRFNFWRIIEIFALILAVIGVLFAYYQIEYPKLYVNQTIVNNGDGTGRLQIYVENKALVKPTGTINFFRLNINPNIPHMQVNSLKPGENITFDTDIKIYEKNYSFKERDLPPYAMSSYEIPAHKLYFIMEEISLSYKITCDNCHSQGILKRIPELGKVETGIRLDQLTSEQSGVLKIYNWTTYSIEDLQNETTNNSKNSTS